MLRGAVDGLNVVAPVADANYARLRPTIALARPGEDGGALDLDGYFGLHPALAPLLPLWEQKKLAFVHASGSPRGLPLALSAAGFESTVLLALQILPNGRVGAVRIDKSSGYLKLDDSAAREARRWRMKPGTSDGTAMPMWKRVPIKFQLKN